MKKVLAYGLFIGVLSLSACNTDSVQNTDTDNSIEQNINNEYGTYLISDNEIGIQSYIGTSSKNELVIPQYIDGKKVVAIADYAFANNVNGKNNITSIVIPASVKEIGKNAFYKSENISSITFQENSELTSIGDGAFSIIPSLNSFTITSNVNYIGRQAFANSGIINFNVNGNTNYLWQNNFLIDKNVSDSESYIAIYANPKVSEFTVPSNVKSLSASIFENNQNINSINLSQVEYIGVNAFANSTITNISGGDKIKGAGENSFRLTPWLESQNSQYVTLGSVLIEYSGTEFEVIIPEGITRISENSFNNQMIESIILPTTLISIGKNAFTKCSNLKWVLFNSTQPPVLDGDAFNNDVTLYVKESSYHYFKDSIFFKNISNTILIKKVN
jgi:BspA type Leucine rich repeat region (6 copies)